MLQRIRTPPYTSSLHWYNHCSFSSPRKFTPTMTQKRNSWAMQCFVLAGRCARFILTSAQEISVMCDECSLSSLAARRPDLEMEQVTLDVGTPNAVFVPLNRRVGVLALLDDFRKYCVASLACIVPALPQRSLGSSLQLGYSLLSRLVRKFTHKISVYAVARPLCNFRLIPQLQYWILCCCRPTRIPGYPALL